MLLLLFYIKLVKVISREARTIVILGRREYHSSLNAPIEFGGESGGRSTISVEQMHDGAAESKKVRLKKLDLDLVFMDLELVKLYQTSSNRGWSSKVTRSINGDFRMQGFLGVLL